ncbi:hypothetical protein LEP1GSC116_3074 [Leptospira interrogans serovar Icterohaemorrhagiae str. Verdun HP]|uniref:Uncharacterized protein n=2 Tax=Leptospira interrogans TaxID=173 RepID=M6RF22_LEPIR|nr:hypothetical protein LEP1GSC158_3618 [Leptospira interrogans serovar Zanoni str. LT2156]EMO03194.1 hypothetical protein LEP1GSC116_3074 [Leptospira interrogans serovar Icterohaemorrhagiae str. Verdun HP]
MFSISCFSRLKINLWAISNSFFGSTVSISIILGRPSLEVIFLTKSFLVQILLFLFEMFVFV